MAAPMRVRAERASSLEANWWEGGEGAMPEGNLEGGFATRAARRVEDHAETWASANSLGVSARDMERRSAGRSSWSWWVLRCGPLRRREGGTAGNPRNHQCHSFLRATPKSARQVSTYGGPKICARRVGGCSIATSAADSSTQLKCATHF